MVAQKGAEQQRLNRQPPLPGTMKVHVNAKMKATDDQSSILVCGVKSLFFFFFFSFMFYVYMQPRGL